MFQLVGVEDRPHRDNDTLGDLEPGDPQCPALRIVEDEAGLAVDAYRRG